MTWFWLTLGVAWLQGLKDVFIRSGARRPESSCPEALEDGRTALFCAPGDRQGLAARLAELISQPDLRRRLSCAGRQAYLARFSAQAFIESLFDAYRRHLKTAIEPAVGGDSASATRSTISTEIE